MAEAKKKKPAKKAKTKSAAAAKPRKKKLTKAQSKVEIKRAHKAHRATGSFKLTRLTFSVFREFWRPLGGIILVFLALNIIFASGLSVISTSATNLKSTLSSTNSPTLSDAYHGLNTILGSNSATSAQASSLMQSFLIILGSLVIIWALRHLLAEKYIKVKDAYYHSMYPLVPFLLVTFVIILQLLPLIIGASVLGIVYTSALGSSLVEFIAFVIFLLLAAWSFYMLAASILSLYIVTLPNMHPMQALRSAKQLVHYRRLSVIRKILFLPLVILVIMAVILLPLILYASVLVAPVFYFLSLLSLFFTHTYLYSLYRSLIHESR